MAPSIYLINPRSDAPFYFGAEAHAAWGFGNTVLLADAALATVAALAPPDFAVTLCDEGISPVDFDTPAEFVGITGKISQETRMIELAREFRRRGKIVIVGGPYASLSPARLRDECDILVQGEFENIAGKFFLRSEVGRLATRIHRRQARSARIADSALGSLSQRSGIVRNAANFARLSVRVRILRRDPISRP
jgi:hypothetical protein